MTEGHGQGNGLTYVNTPHTIKLELGSFTHVSPPSVFGRLMTAVKQRLT